MKSLFDLFKSNLVTTIIIRAASQCSPLAWRRSWVGGCCRTSSASSRSRLASQSWGLGRSCCPSPPARWRMTETEIKSNKDQPVSSQQAVRHSLTATLDARLRGHVWVEGEIFGIKIIKKSLFMTLTTSVTWIHVYKNSLIHLSFFV